MAHSRDPPPPPPATSAPAAPPLLDQLLSCPPKLVAVVVPLESFRIADIKWHWESRTMHPTCVITSFHQFCNEVVVPTSIAFYGRDTPHIFRKGTTYYCVELIFYLLLLVAIRAPLLYLHSFTS